MKVDVRKFSYSIDVYPTFKCRIGTGIQLTQSKDNTRRVSHDFRLCTAPQFKAIVNFFFLDL